MFLLYTHISSLISAFFIEHGSEQLCSVVMVVLSSMHACSSKHQVEGESTLYILCDLQGKTNISGTGSPSWINREKGIERSLHIVD